MSLIGSYWLFNAILKLAIRTLFDVLCQLLVQFFSSMKTICNYIQKDFKILLFTIYEDPQSTFIHPLLSFIKELNRIFDKNILKNPKLHPFTIFQYPFTWLL